MGLRPYQIDAVERVSASMRAGNRRVCLVMGTGGGKSLTCGHMVLRAVQRGKKVLWGAHRSELIGQACAALTELGLTVGSICAGSTIPPNPYAAVQVASPQTLLARGNRPPADLVILDEAHHWADAAKTYKSIMDSYPNAYMVGPTATPERGDGCGLEGSWDSLVIGALTRELTDLGVLVPCRVLRPDRPLGPGEIAKSPVDAYIEHASPRLAIVFTRSVALAEQYAAEFRARGITSKCVSADTPVGERSDAFKEFCAGRIRVLTNVSIATEGTDIPEMSCVILARGCGSAGLMIQIIGRALRSYCICGKAKTGAICSCGKKDALVLDLRGVTHEHGLPTDDRVFSLDGKGIRLADPNCYCPVCGSPRESGEGCAVCGYVAGAVDESGKPDKVMNLALKPYQAALAGDSDEKKAERLTRWIIDGRSKGYKYGWALKKFESCYSSPPSAAVRSMVKL